MLILNLKYNYIEAYFYANEKSEPLFYKATESGINGYIYDSVRFIRSIDAILKFFNASIKEVVLVLYDHIIESSTVLRQYEFNKTFEQTDYSMLKKILKNHVAENGSEMLDCNILELKTENVKIENPLKLYISNLEYIANVVFFKKMHKINFEKIFELFNIKNLRFVSGILYESKEKYEIKNNELVLCLNANSIEYIYCLNNKSYSINVVDFGYEIFVKKICEKFNVNFNEASAIFFEYFSFVFNSYHLQKIITINSKEINKFYFLRVLKNELKDFVQAVQKIISKYQYVSKIKFVGKVAQLEGFSEVLNLNIPFEKMQNKDYLNSKIIATIHKDVSKEKQEQNNGVVFKTWRWILDMIF